MFVALDANTVVGMFFFRSSHPGLSFIISIHFLGQERAKMMARCIIWLVDGVSKVFFKLWYFYCYVVYYVVYVPWCTISSGYSEVREPSKLMDVDR